MTWTLTALLIGLASTLHCAGMCGGIIASLSLSLPPEVRRQRRRLAAYTLAYSAGRIASYAAAGLLVGLLGEAASSSPLPEAYGILPRLLAGALVIAVGLHLAGWLPSLARLTGLGQPLWSRLRPLGQRLLPVRTPGRALLFGAVWGWLPCGMVYTALVLAALRSGPHEAVLFMIAFGLGTLPAVLATGMVGGLLADLRRRPQMGRALGLAVAATGGIGIWLALAAPHTPLMAINGT